MLPDHKILASVENETESNDIKIEPFDIKRVKPASYDLTLGPEILTFNSWQLNGPIDPRKNTDWTVQDRFRMGPASDFVLMPGQFVLGHTNERVTLGSSIAASVEGKSSLGRLGLMVHVTAGFIDPGFSGQITLELCNLNPLPIILFLKMPICQIGFFRLETPATIPYGEDEKSKYLGQTGATPSRYFKNFEQENE